MVNGALNQSRDGDRNRAFVIHPDHWNYLRATTFPRPGPEVLEPIRLQLAFPGTFLPGGTGGWWRMRRTHRVHADLVRRSAPYRKLIRVVRTALPQETCDPQEIASLPREFMSESSVNRDTRIRYLLVVERQLVQAVRSEPAPGRFIKRQARIEAPS